LVAVFVSINKIIKMEVSNEVLAALNNAEGLIKFLGGSSEKIAETPFIDILAKIIQNGGSVSFNVSKLKQSRPAFFEKSYLEY